MCEQKPTLASLRGIAPNITDGKDAATFLRELRGGQPLANAQQRIAELENAREAAVRWLNTLFKNRPCQSILDEEVKDVVIRAIALLEGAGEATDGEAE